MRPGGDVASAFPRYPAPAGAAEDAARPRTGGEDASTNPSKHAAAAARPGKAAIARDAFFDNAKFFAILLVVVGHSTVGVDHMRVVGTAYRLFYIFHMPAFILIAGYFAKNFDYSRRKIQRLLAGVLVPYLVFWVVYNIVDHYALGSHISHSPLNPIWLTWFLAALFVWRLTGPFWRWVRWPLPVAIAIALLANVIHIGGMFAMPRVIELLPFYVLGLVVRREQIAYLHQKWVRIASGVVFAVVALTIFFAAPTFSKEWVYWRKTLVQMHYHPLAEGLLLRAGMMLLAVILVAAFLSLVPRHRSWYTAFGAGTIYAYLFHGMFIRAADKLDIYPHLATPLGLVLVVVVAAGVAIGLMSPPVRKVAHWLVEPQMNWAFASAPAKPARDGQGGTADGASGAAPRAAAEPHLALPAPAEPVRTAASSGRPTPSGPLAAPAWPEGYQPDDSRPDGSRPEHRFDAYRPGQPDRPYARRPPVPPPAPDETMPLWTSPRSEPSGGKPVPRESPGKWPGESPSASQGAAQSEPSGDGWDWFDPPNGRDDGARPGR